MTLISPADAANPYTAFSKKLSGGSQQKDLSKMTKGMDCRIAYQFGGKQNAQTSTFDGTIEDITPSEIVVRITRTETVENKSSLTKIPLIGSAFKKTTAVVHQELMHVPLAGVTQAGVTQPTGPSSSPIAYVATGKIGKIERAKS